MPRDSEATLGLPDGSGMEQHQLLDCGADGIEHVHLEGLELRERPIDAHTRTLFRDQAAHSVPFVRVGAAPVSDLDEHALVAQRLQRLTGRVRERDRPLLPLARLVADRLSSSPVASMVPLHSAFRTLWRTPAESSWRSTARTSTSSENRRISPNTFDRLVPP